MSPWSAVRQALRREHRDRVARVDPGPLDVLHEPRDEHVDAVAHGVDVHLEPLEVGVDAHRAVVVDRGRDGQLADQVLRAVAELDGQAADDEAGPHDDRVADPVGDRDGLLDGGRHAALWLGDAQSVDEAREARPLLGEVDGLERQARQVDARGDQGVGQVEGRLAAELDERGQRRVARARLGVDDLQHALRRRAARSTAARRRRSRWTRSRGWS